MYSTTELFDRRIRQSGKRKTVVDIHYNGQVVETDIPVSGGDIRVDRSASIRRTASIQIADRKMVPSLEEGGVLEPYGTEFKVRHGIVYPNGQEELLPMGMFVLDATSWNEANGPIPTVNLVDRAMIMSRAQIGPVLSASGKLALSFLEQTFYYFWPDLTITYGSGLDLTARLPGGTAFDNGEHWAVVSAMATAMGGEIYFDQDGLPVVNPLPEFDETTTVADAVYTVDAGENGVLIDATRSVTREEVYNSVYVVGAASEGGSVPIGHVYNNDPASPTYREGPFRKMGIRIENNLLNSNAKCIAYANEELLRYRRLARTLDLTMLPNPALDAGDIVKVVYLDAEEEPALIQGYTYPLAGGAMGVQTAIQRL